MNDGYLFLIGCWILIVLVASQWLDFIWKKGSPIPRKRMILLLFLFLLLASQPFYLSVTPKLSIHIGMYVIAGGMFLYYFYKDPLAFRLQIVAVILFLAVFYAVAYEMFLLDPILMLVPPVLLIPAFMSVFVVLTTTNIKHQWLMLTGGFLLGELGHKTFLLRYVDYVHLGDAIFRDQYIVALFLTTMLYGLILICLKGIRMAFRSVVRVGKGLKPRHSDGQ